MVETKSSKIKDFLTQSQDDAVRKDLGKIITRLKQKAGPMLKPTDKVEELSFKNVSIKEKSGFVGFVGSFYSSFTSPVNSLASFLAKMPFAIDLRNTLDSAGIYVSSEAYLVIVSTVSFLASIIFLAIFGILGVALYDLQLIALAPVIAIIIFILVAIFGMLYPLVLADSRAAKIDRSLPFALRQLSTQVKAGLSFYKSLLSLSHSDYGVLSEEFRVVLRDMDSGLSTQDALLRLHARTRSSGLRKAIMQIVRTMRTGGNLSQVVSDIADDVSFETRMKIRDFTEKLNFVNIIYIMISVVAPVSLAIMSAVMQIPMFAGGFSPLFVLMGFAAIVFLMIMIMYATKRMEPSAW